MRIPPGLVTANIAVFSWIATSQLLANESVGLRARGGLQALYDFSSSGGAVAKDRSGVGEPLDLRIPRTNSVRHSEGSLDVRGKTLIRSSKAATRITDAVRVSGEITIEGWIRPAQTNQSGPARIVTLSKDTGERNFTLGQNGDRFDVRFRTTQTTVSGTPSLSSKPGSLTTELTHIVYTRDRTGRTRIYINGRLNVEKTIAGETSNWDGSFRLALANELSNDRPWLGTFHFVALYNRDLLPHEVEQHFEAGPHWHEAPTPAARPAEPANADNARLFDAEIATLFVEHCLECHDTTTKKGKLDLSRKDAAFAGGRKSKVIVPGHAAESRLWQAVEADEMPDERTPLSAREKERLRQWIEGGAIWTVEVIDPAAYMRHRRSNDALLRRLTVPEYVETVRSAVGVDIAKEAREILPKDFRADGFNNTAYNLNVDLGHVDSYAKLAQIIVGRMDMLAFASEFAPTQKLTTNNMRTLVANMGKWLLRGPLDDRETTAFLNVSTVVADRGGDFKEAVSHVLEAILQSPRFLYQIENQRGDGTPWPVGDYELASRLSYILWGGPPDKELMRAADVGELYDRRNVHAHVQRMLKDPRIIERSLRFVREWLDLDRLENLRPNPARFPKWNAQLAADMREETLALFKEVVWEQKRPLADLLNAQVTFATSLLAEHYGLKPKAKGMSRYDLSSVPGRGGLLTHGSVLTIGGDDASMVTRGLFVLHDFLRGVVKDPPPCVDTTPVPTKPGLTQRAIAETRLANASCGGCHSKFEPLAFGLEKFDGTGAYHEKDEHGNKLREDGEILLPGTDLPIRYQSVSELMNLLAASERVRETLSWKIAQFALGRPLVAADVPVLEKIHALAQKNGGTYESVITAIVMSDLVQTTRTESGK